MLLVAKLTSEVEMCIKGCAPCQQNKINMQTRKAPLSPIYLNPDATPFSPYYLTSLSNFLRDMTLSWQSQTQAVPKLLSLSLAMKLLMQKESPNFIFETSSPGSVHHQRSSLIETLDSHPSLWKNYANMLCHSGDIHLTWAKVPAYDTGKYEKGVQCERLRFEGNLR